MPFCTNGIVKVHFLYPTSASPLDLTDFQFLFQKEKKRLCQYDT